MKKSRKISVFVTVAVSLIFLNCSNPSSSGNDSGSNNNGGLTPTSPENPDNTPTNPDNPSGGGETPVVNPDIPVYKWLAIQSETTRKTSTSNYISDYYSTSDTTYIIYNDSQQKTMSVGLTNGITTTMLGTEYEQTSTTNTNSKNIITNTIAEDGYYNSSTEGYSKNGSEWMQTGLTTSTYAKTTNGYQFTQESYTKNGEEFNLTSTIITSYELISKSANKEIIKVSFSHSPTVYLIQEYENTKLSKSITYVNDKKTSEITYIQPNNTTILERLPDFTLSISKTYDTNETLVSEYYQTLEDVIIDEAQNILTIKTGQSTNTDSNYTYTTTKYKKMQVPFSNE